jgi:hypothetical protein
MDYFRSALVATRDSDSSLLTGVYLLCYWVGALVSLHVTIACIMFIYKHTLRTKADLL